MVITLIIALIIELAINFLDETSMVGLVNEVNQFTLLVAASIGLAVKTCGTI